MLVIKKNDVPLQRISGFSAVGSALRSGRRGRAFESPNPDKTDKRLWVHSLLLFINCTLSFRNYSANKRECPPQDWQYDHAYGQPDRGPCVLETQRLSATHAEEGVQLETWGTFVGGQSMDVIRLPPFREEHESHQVFGHPPHDVLFTP